jgi:hypothetical protein
MAPILTLAWLGCGAKVVVDGPTLEGDCETFCKHVAACELEGYGGEGACQGGCLETVRSSFDCEPASRAVLVCHLEHIEGGNCDLLDVCQAERDELNRCDEEG